MEILSTRQNLGIEESAERFDLESTISGPLPENELAGATVITGPTARTFGPIDSPAAASPDDPDRSAD